MSEHRSNNKTMNNSQDRPCGDWPSPLTPELIFEGRQIPAFPLPWQGGVLFLLSMPEEANAQVLMFAAPGQALRRVSPPGFNLRSRVHEYGGMPFTAGDNELYYCNFADQEIYRQPFDVSSHEAGDPIPLTGSGGTQIRYADLLVDKRRRRLICVREDHRAAGGKAERVLNNLVAIPLDGTAPVDVDKQVVLYKASDFVVAPCLSANNDRLAFVTWSHPNMPFDNTELRLARLGDEGQIEYCQELDADEPASRLQPCFDGAGGLYFLSDQDDYWNLRYLAPKRLEEGYRSHAAYPIDADCCPAPWQMGNRNYDLLDDGDLVISVLRECQWQLHRFSPGPGRPRILVSDLGQVEQLRAAGPGKICLLTADVQHYPVIEILDLNSQAVRRTTVYRSPQPVQLGPALISRPRHFTFSSANGAHAHGLFLEPCNSDVCSSAVPPLLVNVHGGPTGTARAVLNPLHQFWTSRGFAVLDLNHRGSTGYGRRFRRLLYGQWGCADIEDIVAAVEHLVAEGRVNRRQIAIRGGSAGGYAVLASLAACDLFAAGVSYYGVSDLELLARDTHKFESRYLDQLIGPYPARRDLYRARSPINHLESITAPVLLLQGEEDRVVPMNQAETIYRELSALNPATELLRFPGEAHGFRKPASQIRALETELDFYRRNLLGLPPVIST